MKIENRQQVLAAAAIAVVALFLLDRMVFTPLLDGWKERSRRIVELQKSIRDGEALLQRGPALQERWASMKSGALGAADAEGRLLEAFQKWARQSNISISRTQPSTKRGADDEYMTQECRVTASGPMAAIAEFLYHIEKDPMALRIESMEITARDEKGQTLALNLQVSGLVLGGPSK